MKKIWNIRKDSKAVSPVIATILMVAITVVLAAVLYVMVMGFGGSETQTPTGAFTTADSKGGDVYWLYLGVITPSTDWDQCKLSLNGTLSGTALSDTGTQVISGVTIEVVDLAVDGKISTGDYIIVSSLEADEDYIAALIFVETGGTIDTIEFTN